MEYLNKDFSGIATAAATLLDEPDLYGYNIEHLKLIAQILQKENLPPERVTEALIDISRIVLIIKDEFEERLLNAVKEGLNGISE